MTGDIGSGKSRVSAYLRDKLNFKNYSTGDLQRHIAKQKNLTTLELNHLSEKDESIDHEIDGFTKSLRDTKEDLIIDSRLAWHFLPTSFKIYLFLEPVVAAERILRDKNRLKESYANFEETLKAIQERQKSEINRFKKMYHVKLNDWNNYDLIINTKKASVREVGTKILTSIELKKNNQKFPKKIFF